MPTAPRAHSAEVDAGSAGEGATRGKRGDAIRRNAIGCGARTASLAVALSLSAVLLLYPRALGVRLGPAEHALLPLLLLGMSGAFVVGLGYRPDNRLARAVFSPAASWSLMGLGIAALVLRRLTA